LTDIDIDFDFHADFQTPLIFAIAFSRQRQLLPPLISPAALLISRR